MKPRCADEVEAHLGRPPTAAELRDIEDRLNYHARQTNSEAAANGWSPADAAREAARRAAAEVMGEATKKAQQTALQVAAVAAKQERYTELKAVYKGNSVKALGRMLEQSYSYIKGAKAQAFSKIIDAIEAADPRFLKTMENAGATRDFVREIFGEDTGNQVAARGAKAWLDGVEQLRVRANRAGFNIGKLDYGYVPQPHNVVAMLKAGKAAWTEKILPRLDRSKYLNNDGSRMTDAQMQPVLERAFDTITTNGTNKMDPANFQGAGARANRGSAHREIHFASADDYLAHMGEFGRGTIWDAMKSHVDSTAGSVGLVEEYGPNPQAHFDMLNRQEIKDNGGVNGRYGIYSVDPKHMWDTLAGIASQTMNQRTGAINQGLRNLQVATKLGSTFLGAGNDAVTLATTAMFNQMPVMRTIGTIFSTMGKDSRKFAAEAGLGVNSIVGDMATFGSENMFGHGWTSKLANGVMKASLLEGWTHALQRGFSVSMMHALADLSHTEWGALAAADVKRLKNAGVTPEDWGIWRDAPRQSFDGAEIIHHDDITAAGKGLDDAGQRAHDHAASSLLGYIASEADAALVIPDNYTQAALVRGLKKGTVEGEIARHVALFKGYTAAIGHRYIERIADLDMSKAGKFGLGITFMAAMTMFGALTMQLKAIAGGKDPYDMVGPHAGKFWASALFQGGGSGIMGDLVNQITSSPSAAQQTSGVAGILLGPTIGSGLDLATATLGEAGKKARGEKTDVGARLLQFGRYNTPIGAPMNLWYTRQAVDHAFFHELQDAASPGYLARQQSRQQQQWGQSSWWKPGRDLPQRGPDLGKAVGQ